MFTIDRLYDIVNKFIFIDINMLISRNFEEIYLPKKLIMTSSLYEEIIFKSQKRVKQIQNHVKSIF